MNRSRMDRKLAAVLYADVCEYSRLTGEDEEGTHATLSASLDLLEGGIEGHGGRVVHFAGDAILADFSSAIDAVACAVQVQDALARGNRPLAADRRLQFRMGINLGDVIVDRDDIFGDGVNVAARLETLAEPGGICISESVRDAVGNKLPLGYAYLGEQQVKNIAKPVRAYRVSTAPDDARAKPAPARPRRWMAVAAIAMAAVVGLGVTVWLLPRPADERASAAVAPPAQSPPPAVAETPSIAVLPFANLSDEPTQAYFADGMTDDLITDLTKVPGLVVISRETTINFRGESPDIRELGQTLDVRFVLQGSVRRVADAVRINAQLIDAGAGRHVWGERYDGQMADIFTLQDQITADIVTALALTLAPTDRERVERRETENLKAYQAFLRGRDHFFRFSRDDTLEAQRFLERAIELDPTYAQAIALLAWVHAFHFTNGWSDTPKATLATAIDLANRALALDEAVSVAYFVRGLVFRERRQFVQAIAEAQKAIDLDPSYATSYVLLATILYYAGRAEDGLRLIEKAERVNPINPSNYPFHKGQALFILKRYDDAIAEFERGLEQNPTSQRLRVWLAVTYAQAGRMEDAEWEAEQVLMADPDFSLGRLTHIFPFEDPKDLAHFTGALTKVGFENRW